MDYQLRKQLLLYAVTASDWLNGRSLVDAAREALQGGATMLQLREKDLPDDQLLASARELYALCNEFQVPLIINDNVKLAAALINLEKEAASKVSCDGAGATVVGVDTGTVHLSALPTGANVDTGVDTGTVHLSTFATGANAPALATGANAVTNIGVHLGQQDMDVYDARRLLGDDVIIGASVETVEQAIIARDQGASYLGVGAVFSTDTKTDATIVSLDVLAEICEACDLPVVAIGGICEDNIIELSGSGIVGVAVVSGIFASENIFAATQELRLAAQRVLRPVCGVIFDMDGTLLDSMAVWEDAGCEYLTQLGITPELELGERLIQMSLEESAAYLVRHYMLDKSPAEVAAGINQCIANAYFDSIPVKGRAGEVVASLYACGIPLCVCTATNRELAEAALERLGLLDYFCDIVTIAESGYTKRDPQIFELARQSLGTKRNSTWVVEDALHALTTAAQAGFYTVSIYEPTFAGAQAELKAIADIYVEKIEDWMWQ